MRPLPTNGPSSFGAEVTVRIARPLTERLTAHMRQDASIEQMAFALARPAKTATGTLFVVSELILPEAGDLAVQTGSTISPTRPFQAYVYLRARQVEAAIVEFHTHLGRGVPHFSPVDHRHAGPNAECIYERFAEPVTLVMLVANARFDAFDGLAYDRHRKTFFPVDSLEILGRPNEVRFMCEPSGRRDGDADRQYDRQALIPGFDQLALERQRIGIVGLGGNGAPLLETLLGIGAGRRGFIALADHDLIEPSNLPRIPYACSCDVGLPKVTVAARYAGFKSRRTPVYPFPCRFGEQAVLSRMKMATVLFHCGDNDGTRKQINEFAVRYAIPLVDLGCDIQVEGKSVVAGGQVRLVLPGQNACLVCSGRFDPAQAALDEMDEAGRAGLAAHGYVRGANMAATPSIANLNGLTAQHAVSQFLALANGTQFADWDYLHFDAFAGRTIPASTTRQETCPVCGISGTLAAADPIDRPSVPPAIERLTVQSSSGGSARQAKAKPARRAKCPRDSRSKGSATARERTATRRRTATKGNA